jgi:hypothetical protein
MYVIIILTPFLISPKGENQILTPSPLGEGWEGGNYQQNS